MNVTVALKKILNDSPFLCMKTLNERLGYGDTKNAAATRLGRKTMSLENLIKFADALDYDVVLVPKRSRDYAKNEYVITRNERDGDSE